MLAIQWYKIQEILQPQISYNRPLSYLSLTSIRNTNLSHADAWMHSAEFYVQCLFLFIRFKSLVEICKSHQIILLVWRYFVCENVFEKERCPSEDSLLPFLCQEMSLRQRRTKTRTWSSILFRKTETVCLWWLGNAELPRNDFECKISLHLMEGTLTLGWSAFTLGLVFSNQRNWNLLWKILNP